jgi:hypothetical protein|eukprot:COSAG02_NODE_6013_length_3876_cov_5.943341_1_plen_341_part_00
MGDAETIAARKNQLEESLRALDYYKDQNEEALRQALKKDEAVKKHTKATSKDAVKRERVEWLQRIVDEESTKPLQVPKNYVQGYTEQATEYSRQIANNNARRSYTLAKIEDGAKKRATRRNREKEYKRRWNATKGADDPSALSTNSVDDEDEDGALDEISQLAAQVRTQAERHAVDGSLPLEESGLGTDMVDEFSMISTDEPVVRQTVFRKKRTDSTLTAPAQAYYTVKQTSSEGNLSVGQGSEYGDEAPARRSSRRSQSRGSTGFNNTTSSLGSMSMSSMPRDHIEKLEMQVCTTLPLLLQPFASTTDACCLALLTCHLMTRWLTVANYSVPLSVHSAS